MNGDLPQVNENVVLIKGFFEDTLSGFLNSMNKKVSFVHIDCDLYSSTKHVLNNLINFIDNECIIVFDELVNYAGFDGETGELKAFYEFVIENNIRHEWIGMDGVLGDHGKTSENVAVHIYVNSLNLKVFVVFHDKIYPEIYEVNDEHTKYLTFYGVKNEQENKTPMDIVYEKDLPLYEPIWQNLHYNEASALYHIYKNRIHCGHEFIGFFQYDMKVLSNCFSEIEDSFKTNNRTIFYSDFFPWKYCVHLLCFKEAIQYYNEFFKTNFTIETLVLFKMPVSNTFVIHKTMFEKMMNWMSQYYITDSSVIMQNKYDISDINEDITPGHVIEVFTGVFLCLEVAQGAEYKLLNIQHDHTYKVVR